MKNKLLAGLLTAAMAAVMATGCAGGSGGSSTGDGSSGKESYKIGISQFAEHGSLDNCREGFLAGILRTQRLIWERQGRYPEALYLIRWI